MKQITMQEALDAVSERYCKGHHYENVALTDEMVRRICEVKSLVNMGFTELEMNFSDQNQPKKEQGQKSYKGSKFSSDDAEQSEPVAPRLELVVPRYV